MDERDQDFESEEEEETSEGVLYDITEEESAYVDSFCEEMIKTKNELEIEKEAKKNISLQKKDLTERLRQYLDSIGKTCIPLPIRGELKQHYLRLHEKTCYHSISQDYVVKSVDNLSYDKIVEEVESMERKLERTPNIMEVVSHVFSDAMEESTKYIQRSVNISKSAERAKKGQEKKTKLTKEEVKELILPDEIKDVASRWWKKSCELKVRSDRVKKLNKILKSKTNAYLPPNSSVSLKPDSERLKNRMEMEELHRQQEKSREVLSGYIRRKDPEDKSVRVDLRSKEGNVFPFALREKEKVTKVPFPKKEYERATQRVFEELFKERELDYKQEFREDYIDFFLDEDFIKDFVELMVKYISEWREKNSISSKSITLDKWRGVDFIIPENEIE